MIRNRDRGQQTGFAYEFSPILILALFKTDFCLERVGLSTHWFSCLQKMSLESKFREKKILLKGKLSITDLYNFQLCLEANWAANYLMETQLN